MSTTFSPLTPNQPPNVIDYAGRVQELCDFAEREYGIDGLDTRILAASLLLTRHTPVWLICDSTKNEFWKDFGEVLRRVTGTEIGNVAYLRILRPRYVNARVEEYLEHRRNPRLFLDTRLDGPLHPNTGRSRFPELEAECLRLRVRLPWTKIPALDAPKVMEGLLRKVLDPEHRPFLPVPLSDPPEMLKYAVKMVMVANPALTHGGITLKNACLIGPAYAVLHGRNWLTEEDHQITYRALKETIRPWTSQILLAFSENSGYLDQSDLAIHTGLSHELIHSECARLAAAGVLEWPKPKGKGNRRRWIRLEPGLGDDMGMFMNGGMRWW